MLRLTLNRLDRFFSLFSTGAASSATSLTTVSAAAQRTDVSDRRSAKHYDADVAGRP